MWARIEVSISGVLGKEYRRVPHPSIHDGYPGLRHSLEPLQEVPHALHQEGEAPPLVPSDPHYLDGDDDGEACEP